MKTRHKIILAATGLLLLGIGIVSSRYFAYKYMTLYDAIHLRDIRLVNAKVADVQDLNMPVNGWTYLTLCFWSHGRQRREYSLSEEQRIEYKRDTLEMVKVLVEHGADVNIKCQNREEGTPLNNAIFLHMEDVMQYLLDRGASVKITDNRGWTPLMYAVLSMPSCLDTLFQKGAKETINYQDNEGNTALHLSLDSQDDPKTVEYLIQKGADMTIINKSGRTAIDQAMRSKRIISLKVLEKYQENDDSKSRIVIHN